MKKKASSILMLTAALALSSTTAFADMGVYDVVTSKETTKVILDSDMRYLTDDMYTLMFLLQADAAGYIDLLGVTTANPGVRTEVEAQMALSMLERVGRSDIPVYVGENTPLDGMWYADSELVSKWNLRTRDSMIASIDPHSEVDYSSMNLGGEYDPALNESSLVPETQTAWKFMTEQVANNPGEVIIMSIGSCTNTALAVQNDPDFAGNTAGIYYMGGITPEDAGAIGNGSFNWASDAKAVNVCLEADFPKQVLIPSEISETVKMTKDVMDRIVAGDTPVSSFMKEFVYPTWEAEPERVQSFWDVVTPAVLMIPDIVDNTATRYMTLCEEIGPFKGLIKQWEDGKQPEGLNPVQVVWTINNDVYWNFLVDLYTTNF